MNPLKEKIESTINKDILKDKENLEIVEYLAEISKDVKIDAHFERKVSKKLEMRDIQLTREYLKEFEKVNEVVQKFDEIAHRMNSMCINLYQNIEKVRIQNASMVKKSASLQERKIEVEEKFKKIDDFLETYSLKQDELRLFEECQETGRLSDSFFRVLERAESIREECRILVQDHSNVAAFEIFEQMQDFLDLGINIISANLKREFMNVNNDALQKKLIISKSFQVLQQNRELLKVMLETYSKTKANTNLHQFTELNKTPANMCNDPIRNVTDMLTYIHSLIENEQELIECLLSLCEKQVLADYKDEILDHSLKSLCVPFKVRVEKLLSVEKDPIIICKLGNILDFYGKKFPSGFISKMISDISSTIRQIAKAGVRFSVNSLMSKMSLPNTNELLPVPEVRSCLVLYEGLIQTKFFDEESIFEMVVGQLIQTVQMSATRLKKCEDISIFIINCLTLIKSSIHSKNEKIEAMIESNEDVLVSETLSKSLNTSGILEIYQKMQEYSSIPPSESGKTPVSQLSGLEADKIQSSLQKFADFLHNNGESSGTPECLEKILETSERLRIRQRIAAEFLNVYKYVIENLELAENKFAVFHYLPVDQVELFVLI